MARREGGAEEEEGEAGGSCAVLIGYMCPPPPNGVNTAKSEGMTNSACGLGSALGLDRCRAAGRVGVTSLCVVLRLGVSLAPPEVGGAGSVVDGAVVRKRLEAEVGKLVSGVGDTRGVADAELEAVEDDAMKGVKAEVGTGPAESAAAAEEADSGLLTERCLLRGINADAGAGEASGALAVEDDVLFSAAEAGTCVVDTEVGGGGGTGATLSVLGLLTGLKAEVRDRSLPPPREERSATRPVVLGAEGPPLRVCRRSGEADTGKREREGEGGGESSRSEVNRLSG